MSLDPTVFLAEFTALVRPIDATATGIYEIKQAQALSDEQIEDKGGWPYWVYDLAPSTAGDWGLVNAAQEATLTAHFVDQDRFDDAVVWARLRSLAKAVLAATFTGMTVLDVGGMNVHPSHAAEAVFLNKNAAFVAGSVAFSIVFGETALG